MTFCKIYITRILTPGGWRASAGPRHETSPGLRGESEEFAKLFCLLVEKYFSRNSFYTSTHTYSLLQFSFYSKNRCMYETLVIFWDLIKKVINLVKKLENLVAPYSLLVR